MKGNIKLPIREKGKEKIIEINEGEIFLLPGCIPHSPQRPEEGSLGEKKNFLYLLFVH